MPSYKLCYFDGRGRAELLRLMFAQTGTPYEDKRIAFDTWGELKKTVPGGQLPYLEIDGTAYGQSLALARYLARQLDLYGGNNLEKLLIDTCIDDIADFRQANIKMFFEKDEAKKAALEKEHKEKVLPAFMAKMDGALLANLKNKTGFIVGTKCTVADLALFDILSGMEATKPEIKEVFKTWPKVQAHMDKINALPNIKAWVAKRPVTNF